MEDSFAADPSSGFAFLRMTIAYMYTSVPLPNEMTAFALSFGGRRDPDWIGCADPFYRSSAKTHAHLAHN